MHKDIVNFLTLKFKATKRVDQKKLDLLWKYFRPFVSKKDEVVGFGYVEFVVYEIF